MRVSWCGQSYFIVTGPGGVRLAVDPHDGDSLGLPRCEADADYILVTHDHYDHNAVDVARGPRTKGVALWREGTFTFGPFRVAGVRLPHDAQDGSRYGWTAAYLVEADGVRVLHMGDVGVAPTEDLVRPFGKVDVIMVPAGDVTTVSQAGAIEWAKAVGAPVVIPMHYWLPGSNVPLDPIDVMLSIWRGDVERPGPELEVVKGVGGGPRLEVMSVRGAQA
ncbi:MAG: MBL fold metallo-hydrolase [Acidilobus sp.]